MMDFGIQTAVARFVAHADELGDTHQRDGIVSTAALLLAMATIIGLLGLAILAWQLPTVFKAMPRNLYGEARLSLWFMGASFAIGLPFSVVSAVFIGLQRNEIPVAIVITNRALMAGMIIAVVSKHWGLAAMGSAVACANLLSCVLSCFAWRKWAPHVEVRPSLVSRLYAHEIIRYSAALAIWSAGSLMVSGLDLTIVGIADYSATAYYAVAATLTNFVVQAQSAIFAALLPVSAILGARGDAQRLGMLLISSTRYGLLILLSMAMPLILMANLVLRLWVGPDYALQGTSITQVLLVANAVRLSALPYATFLLGIGEQQKVVLSPLAEGITNLIASIVGAILLGAIGVAIGTLIGAFVSVGLHILYNMPRTPAIAVNRFLLLKDGILRPLLCAMPAAGLIAARLSVNIASSTTVVWLIIGATVSTLWLLWRFGLINSERRRVGEVLAQL
jgi:O-antigen/teichoic acid export membrane protein